MIPNLEGGNLIVWNQIHTQVSKFVVYDSVVKILQYTIFVLWYDMFHILIDTYPYVTS